MSNESGSPAPRRRSRALIAVISVTAAALAVVLGLYALGQRYDLTTNVTIALSYVGDDGRTYSCTYDYRTSHRVPMPAATAAYMNGRDWSSTGQFIYEWAKDHAAESWTTEDEFPADDPRSTRAAASWSLAMDRYVVFPPWSVDTENGREYELWWEVRPGSTCEDGLR